MEGTVTAYERLRDRMAEAVVARSAAGVLGWDQETSLPAAGVPFRAEQLAWLNGRVHELSTAPEVGGWLDECEAAGFDPDGIAATNIRGWRRAHDRATRIPTTLIEEFSRTTSLAHSAWIDARHRSEFDVFRPHLERVVELVRRKTDCLGWSDSPYDALLDEYEPGARTRELTALFETLAPQLAALVGPAAERSAGTPKSLLAGHYPIDAQRALNREVAEAVGFDFSAGRIDTAVHPFCCGLGPADTRLTTRYAESDFTVSLSGVLHEAGHGLYDQGLNRAEWGLPAGDAASLGIHESQSRLWENHIGGSAAFWDFWLPRARQHFPDLPNLPPEKFAAATAPVRPSFIRVDADEVTYDLHIILRFEIEQALVSGDLAVVDVPAAWNERFRALLGLEVPDDARGCLQDVHWSFGSIGYFPTYTLGNLNAAQLIHRARHERPGLENALREGDYSMLLAWLREKIHRHGQRWLPNDLMREATGEPTQAQYHLASLRTRFL